jgi:hypothetical protein
MKCRVVKKVARHFWSRFFDPDNPKYRTSTVRKAVQIYDKPLRKKIVFRRLSVKIDHNLPEFDWMDEASPPDPSKLFGLQVGPMTASINGKMLGLVVPNFDDTTSGEREENNE